MRSGWYEYEIIRESYLTKLTTRELLDEIMNRFREMKRIAPTDDRPEKALVNVEQAIGILNWMEEIP